MPVPVFDTVSVAGLSVNVAVTDVSRWSSVTMHVPVPVQPPPDHPVKSSSPSGVAVRVTTVPYAKLVAHVAPQVIPAGSS